MRTIAFSVASIGSLLMIAPASAQTAGAFMNNPTFRDPPPARCVSTVQMQQCAAHDLRAADAQMSARYASLRTRLTPGPRQALLEEQRDWLRSRDSDCIARGNRGGTMASLEVARCWVNVTKARSTALAARSSVGAALPASAFVGRWRGGEGTYMKITRSGGAFSIDTQWGLDAGMQGVFAGKLTSNGLSFRRNGVTETVRPGRGDSINRSALRGKTDCLIVSADEGYCRY